MADLRVGTLVARSYEVTETLGRGGMGTVYAARHVRTGRRVAVKLLHRDTRALPDAIERFRREAKAAGLIVSEHVTKVHDVEEDPDHGIAIIFELLKGNSLLDHLRSNGVMTLEMAVPFVREILQGLEDAHRAGIIHRDLKPSNVFLERKTGGGFRVKLLDFGVSKLPRAIGGDTLTQPDQALGSFLFMPPEQVAKASSVDGRADIYAMGVMVFQAMTGYLPFVGPSAVDVIHQKRTGQPRTLADAAGKPFPEALEAWVRKCLERDPSNRFASAVEARAAWEQLVVSLGLLTPTNTLGSSQGASQGQRGAGVSSPSPLPAGLAPLPSRHTPAGTEGAPPRVGAYAALPPPVARGSGTAVLPSVPTMSAASMPPQAFPSGAEAFPSGLVAAPSSVATGQIQLPQQEGGGPVGMPPSSTNPSSRPSTVGSRLSPARVALVATLLTFLVASIGLMILWLAIRKP